MREVGVLEAKTNLSALVTEVERSGRPIIITRHGRAVVRLEKERRGEKDWKAVADGLWRRMDDLVVADPKAARPYDLNDDRDAIE